LLNILRNADVNKVVLTALVRSAILGSSWALVLYSDTSRYVLEVIKQWLHNAWRSSLLHAFSGFRLLKYCLGVVHRSTLCRQNVNLKRIHAVLLVAYVLLSLVKYLHSVNFAADFFNIGYLVRGTVDWFSRGTVEHGSECAMTWKARGTVKHCIYLSTGQATTE